METNRIGYESGPGGSLVEVGGLPNHRPCGQPREYSCRYPGVNRAKRRFPTCSSAPASAARGRSSSAAGSPFSLTPPCSISRRASEVESTPRRVDEQRRQVHRIAVRKRDLGHVVGRLVPADDAREVLLGLPRGLVAAVTSGR